MAVLDLLIANGYNPELAKITGVEAAALFNKISELESMMPYEDGSCRETDERLSDFTGLSQDRLLFARYVLAESGLVAIEDDGDYKRYRTDGDLYRRLVMLGRRKSNGRQ